MVIMGRAAMPIASNPNITFPWVTVSVFLEGASPEDMARLVAKPIENRFMKLEGKEEIRSCGERDSDPMEIQTKKEENFQKWRKSSIPGPVDTHATTCCDCQLL